jgi:hypothetical protein
MRDGGWCGEVGTASGPIDGGVVDLAALEGGCAVRLQFGHIVEDSV